MCDGSDLRGTTCQDLGYYEQASLACTATCTLDIDQCHDYCGDGIVQPEHELCDGAAPSTTCTDFGYGTGAITCNHCAADLAECKFFGWHSNYVPVNLNDIAGTSDTSVYAVGDGGIMKWNGATWMRVDTGPCGGATLGGAAISTVGDGDIWFADGHIIWHLAPSGCTTKQLAGGINEISSIAVIADDDVWVAGIESTWHFDGQSWTPYSVVTHELWAAGHNDVYAVDGQNTIHHFDGTTWTATTLASSRALLSIWGASPTNIYAAGVWLSTPVIEHYDGTTWTELRLPAPDAVTSITGADHRVFAGFANTNKVRVLEGTGVTTLDTPDLGVHTRIYASPSGHLYVVPVRQPQVFRYDGTDLRDVALGTTQSVAARSPTEIYAALPPNLFAYDGDHWQQDAAIASVNAVAVALTGEPIALTTAGLQIRTGTTWSAASGSPTGLSLWAASPTDVWVQDNSNRLHHWDGTTDTICPSCTMPALVTQFWGTSSTDLYAVLRPDWFKHWDGTSWTDVTTPGLLRPTWIWGWAPNDIVAADLNEGVWQFDGSSWTQLGFPFPTLQLYSIWGTSSTDLFVADINAAIFHYDGAHWSPVHIETAARISSLSGITGIGDTVLFVDSNGPVHHLVRTHPWQ